MSDLTFLNGVGVGILLGAALLLAAACLFDGNGKGGRPT